MAMNFPKDGLVDGVTTYRWNDIEYIWKGGRWQSNKVVGANSATNLRDQLADPDSNLLIGGVSVKDLVGRSLSAPLFTVEWFPSREAIQGGYIAADGSVLSRGAYKEAWEGIAARKVPVIPDADWEAYPEKQGCYTEGDGSSTFRIPDLNGKNLTSYGPVYLGGEGPNITASGRILRDRLQNITGELNGIYGELGAATGFSKGVFAPDPTSSTRDGWKPGFSTTWDKRSLATFDASRVARTGDTTRPITAEGVWCIKLYHKVINEGSVDVEQVVADIAAIGTRVAALEARKSTCLVNATGTGAPHETVSANLPANIAINTRYVLANPFGVNVPVECIAEILINGKWANAGFIYSATGGGGYGVHAGGVQSEGVIVQTGSKSLCATPANSGGLHGINTELSSAPCRIFIRRIDD